MIERHFGHKPYMATFLLIWGALVAVALSVIGFFFVTVSRAIRNVIIWAGWSTTTFSSTLLSGVLLAVVAVLLAILWSRFGRLPRVGRSDAHITDLINDRPRWEHLEHDTQTLRNAFDGYRETMRGGRLQDGERLIEIERQLSSIAAKVNTQPSFDPADIKNKVIVTYQSASLDLGDISRTLTLWFMVRNMSPAWIWPIYRVEGHLVYEGHPLVSTRCAVEWPRPDALVPLGSDRLGLVFHIDQRFAEDLAFKAEDGEFHCDLSGLDVEFMARDAQFHQANIGGLFMGDRQVVRIENGAVASRIRAYVNWRETQY